MSLADLEDTEFTKRMLKVYDDKDYEDPKVIEDIDNMKIEINRHSTTLVIVCVVKMLDILLSYCEKAEKQEGKLSSNLIQRMYTTCAKMYLADLVLYNAMLTSHDDIFY